ncbi:hypothetical protein PGT21_036131 [Puccinia graminis f. sp. tritici]|uniref:Uncharacterized protein n=1 Tax=Puccinia graminis f. sp. tritici TaxID=56615 RepID=A0A5B0QD56_PUCGR|nr:hypothetical protein PGTUg99_036863 [Puccinia graminis f. sp. tritici]KAA1111059.1 hypothetical protein PGT21_036131 [Puccinia graminis f. sp. tritici]
MLIEIQPDPSQHQKLLIKSGVSKPIKSHMPSLSTLASATCFCHSTPPLKAGHNPNCRMLSLRSQKRGTRS